MSMHFLSKALVSLSLLACSTVFATPVTYTITAPIASDAARGDSANFTTTLLFDPGTVITNVRYNVDLTANTPSFLSELTLYFTSTTGFGVSLNPGYMDAKSGTGTYADSADLAAQGISFAVDADGLLHLEFAEAYDDPSVSPDGYWNAGTITFNYDAATDPGTGVPEPASLLLIGAGCAMMGYAGRRRRHGAAV